MLKTTRHGRDAFDWQQHGTLAQSAVRRSTVVRLPWFTRFLDSSRGKLIVVLRRGTHTVDELAAALGVTDNAVRPHLSRLERDGLVTQHGVRRSGARGGKPASTYSLTADADELFPKAYAPALRALLDVLAEHLPAADVDRLVREVGRRLAAEVASTQGGRTGGWRARVDAAVVALNDLGGLAEVEDRQGSVLIRGYSCPWAAIAPAHLEACLMAEALLGAIVGAPVTEQCDRSQPARCCFVLTAA